MNCSAKRKEPQKMSSAVTERGGYSHLAWLLGDLFFTMYRAWCCCAGLCSKILHKKKEWYL